MAMVFGRNNLPDYTIKMDHSIPGWDDSDVLWRGRVVLDPSVMERLSKPKRRHDVDEYIISDRTYGRPDNAQFDNPDMLSQFPNDITLVCRDLESDILECVAFKAYSSERGVRTVTAKGFFLESAKNTDMTDVARLALIRFDNTNLPNEIQLGHAISKRMPLQFRRLGCAALASGSRGSSVVLARDKYHSVTVLLAASDQHPFESVSYTKRGALLRGCTGAGLYSRMESGGPLEILDSKLALGKITPQEYATLREAIRNSEI